MRRSGCSAGVALFRSQSALQSVLASARRPSLGQTEEPSLVREEQRLLSTQYAAADPCRRPPSSRRLLLSVVSFAVCSGVSPSAVARSVQVAVLGRKLALSALQRGGEAIPSGQCASPWVFQQECASERTLGGPFPDYKKARPAKRPPPSLYSLCPALTTWPGTEPGSRGADVRMSVAHFVVSLYRGHITK